MGDMTFKTKSVEIKEETIALAIKEAEERARVAEAKVEELSKFNSLLAKLTESELNNLVCQKLILETAANEANECMRKTIDAKEKSIMFGIAYNKTWSDLKKKYGLPDGIDVDWKTGEIFRKKINIDKEVKG